MRDRIKRLLEEALPLVDLEADFLLGELDSLGVTTILMLLSEEYGVALDSTDATPRNFRSLDSLAEMVRRKLGA
ncbi:MAG: acyl carrier protein [Prevotellaceae bacterium]|nr:acyl carrier protein [Prevotellaceae bacterium]MCD8304802.1 acyl carrier protein [Prevotellaceae bacterium]